jgi:hypothetical protein
MHGAVASVTPALGETHVAPIWTQPLGPCIGSGGFAAVWEVTGDAGVLKVAHADHDLARARMRREAEALRAIGAPAVPRLHGEGVLPDGRAWIWMDKVAGTTVADLIAAGQVRIDQAIAIGDAILAALARVHAAGFAHRDLKPDNLVRARGGAIVILDLGLARKLPVDPDDPTRAGVQVGSLEYMPPEQLLDAAQAGARADIYAFGCVLYELCSGRPPFVGDALGLERAHAALRPPPLAALAAVPPPLEALVHDCLAKLPDRRPQTVTELRARLGALRDATPSMQRVQHSVSVIREGKQPVVLLWAELPKVDRALVGMLGARKITVVSQRGRRVLGGVVGADHADPAGAAVAAARDLAAAGAKVALHLEALAVTSGASGTTISGAAVEKPEEWLPSAAWTGVVITRALAAVLQAPTRAVPELPGFALLGEPSQTAEIFGRDASITQLAQDAAVALARQGPALALLVGEPGVGKSTIARALVPQLRELGARVHGGEVPPPGSSKPSALAELVGDVKGVRAIGDAIRQAAREQPTAILLDNVHLADTDLLDALEYATLGGEPLALWILAIATPRLEQRRPGFGSRAERHLREVVSPLDEEAAVALTAALLKPAEYPPLRALRQIAGIARGNPMHLTMLVRELHDRGAIRTRPNGEHFLDTSVLDALPPIALGPWLAARELAQLSVELVGLARVCAVLGDAIERDELRSIVEAVERRGGATTTLDVDVGLRELAAAGVIAPANSAFAFRQALLQEGIYATTNEDERRTIHAAALEYWTGRPGNAERIARHAEAVGEQATAADAYAQLGAQAEREHRTLDADQLFQGALRNLPARTAHRARALSGRARARAMAQRVADALRDLDEARAIAIEVGDRALELEVMLEQATALDFHEEFARSRALGEEAAARLEAPARALAVRFAAARTLFRGEKFADAEAPLRALLADARAAGDTNIVIEAAGLLVPTLAMVGKLDDAEALSAELIELCAREGDRFHLCAAYINRTWVWSVRGDVGRVADDLRVVIQLAREGGQAHLERAATYNLAQDLLWQGSLDEAQRLARRCLALQTQHGEGSTRLERVLLARIAAARGEAARGLGAIADLTDDERLIARVLDALAAGDCDWEALASSLDALPPTSRLEMWALLAAAGRLSPAVLAQARELASADPIWARRIGEFEISL